MIVGKNRIKHNYTDELELKSLLIRINNRVQCDDKEYYDLDNSIESIAGNERVNRLIKMFIQIKKHSSESKSRKRKLRVDRNRIKRMIIDESVLLTIDTVSYEHFGKLILLMIKNILTKPNFATLGYDAQFYSDSVYKITKYMHNFDHLKISVRSGLPGNAFAYLSEIIHNAFKHICNQKRDERVKHALQVNMEMLDENQALKYVEMHVDDRTRHHDNQINSHESTIIIDSITDGKTLVDAVKIIIDTSKCMFELSDVVKIVYPNDYRITLDEFNELAPLLDCKIQISRAPDTNIEVLNDE